MNKFVSKLIKKLLCEHCNENIVFSPFSCINALSRLSKCVNGESLEQILNNLEINQENLDSYIKSRNIIDNLNHYNALLYNKSWCEGLNYKVLHEIEALQTDIKCVCDIDELVKQVNLKVEKVSHGKIKEILTRSDVSNFVSIVLLNCIYFKDQWLYNFEEDYKDTLFKGLNKETRVRLVEREYRFKFYEDEFLDIVELPYKNSDINCYLFVPRKSSNDIINGFGYFYEKIYQTKQDCEVLLKVPKFKTRSKLELNDIIILCGLDKMFNFSKDWSIVNFSQLRDEAAMKVDKIIQEAYIDFNEYGTEASAATAITTMLISGCCLFPGRKKTVIVDKPFMYALVSDKFKSEPLFIGLVNDV